MRAAVVLALAAAGAGAAAAKDAYACNDLKDAAACSASSTGERTHVSMHTRPVCTRPRAADARSECGRVHLV